MCYNIFVKNILTYILLVLAIALIVAWNMGVFEGKKLPRIEQNFSPEYKIPYDTMDSKG